jgi:hypothetical protein
MNSWACSCGNTEKIQKKQGQHLGEYCSLCSKWVRWVPQDWKKFIWPVGTKHKGQLLSDILVKDRPYLEWAAQNTTGTLQKRAKEALGSISIAMPKDRPKGVLGPVKTSVPALSYPNDFISYQSDLDKELDWGKYGEALDFHQDCGDR